MSDETVKFSVLCSMFQALARNKSSVMKRKHFRTFLDHVYKSKEYFSAIRLILPSLDRERGTYGLKESVLATCLIDALGISRESEDALRLINWRKGGAKTGPNAGNFALVAAEVLQRRQGMTSGGLTIKEVNDLLDRLAAAENREQKTSVLSELIKKTNSVEMKWIVMIILKDLKLGISEKSIFREFHTDAEDLFNVTCDLKLVCEKLKDRTQRNKRQDIEAGKAVRPQLAMRVADASSAWKKLHGKQVVIECKFDGDRIQIHKNGNELCFFSRNFIDHPEYGHAMSSLILQNVLVERCILDGEMLVWDTSTNRFAEFGSNQEIAKASNDGIEGDRQLCCILCTGMCLLLDDVAFDILYVGDTSVIHQSLRERHELLRKVVQPVKGRLEILVPDGGLNVRRPSDEPCWSLIAYSVEDVEKFFKETIENRDEGIVLKDLDSKWEPGDRSGKWLKLKPDYVHTGSDLDVLIIGGYFGSGHRGGEVAQFLVGLADRANPGTYPTRFLSFCRVGTGLSEDELDVLVNKLKPYFRKNENPKKAPNFYEVTNHSKERPDVWIGNPEKSIILSITSDIRTIKTEVFASPYALRFPRIHRVRYDKPWHECLDVQSFVDLVHSKDGTMQRDMEPGGLNNKGPKRKRPLRKGPNKMTTVVPSHFIQTDISRVKEESLLFTNMMFYFVNVPPTYSVDFFHKMVVENGGSFSMNLNDSVTHCIAAERKGIKYQAAVLRGDVLHYSWVLDCYSQKQLLHLQPKYYLFLSDSSKKKLKEEIDAFSDYYYWDLDVTDLRELFNKIDKVDDSKYSTSSFPDSERRFLRNKRLHILRHKWIEDCLEEGQKLQEDAYNLRPESVEWMLEPEGSDFGVSENLDTSQNQTCRIKSRQKPTIRETVKRKRRGGIPARSTRARRGRAVRISGNESENSDSHDELSFREQKEEQHQSVNAVHGDNMEEGMVEAEGSDFDVSGNLDASKGRTVTASTHGKANGQKPTAHATIKRKIAGGIQARSTHSRRGRAVRISGNESEKSDSHDALCLREQKEERCQSENVTHGDYIKEEYTIKDGKSPDREHVKPYNAACGVNVEREARNQEGEKAEEKACSAESNSLEELFSGAILLLLELPSSLFPLIS
ncbi:hypothetical protein AMTR_s00025p00149970 [Amborella trichopoda]|uniref:DNA ligase n=1 Tax=Amborella trichopoda TaxID=13333 RepID=W1PY88_AMBTC|nr:hypothetical protein AMTR_s00025p00149970 [Amborella trichopoda]